MNSSNRLIIKDKKCDLWEFYLTKNGDLAYSIVSKDGKYKEEGRIDTGVMEFASDMDKDGIMHFVYINKNGELKYYKLEDGQWSSKTIYYFKENNYAVRELSLCIIDEDINIFYIFQKQRTQNTGILCHNRWDGEKCTINVISYIKLLPNVCAHYQIDVQDKQDINLLFINNTGKEVTFKNCKYQNNIYSAIVSLFALKGNSLDFFMAKHGTESHLLNLSNSNLDYTLEDICLDSQGKVASITNIYQSDSAILDILLIVDGDTLWAFWIADGKILYSSFLGQWSRVEELKMGLETTINMYCYIEQVDNENRRIKRVLGTTPPDIKLLLPSKPQENTQKNKNEDSTLNKVNCSQEANMVTSGPGGVGPEKTMAQMEIEKKPANLSQFHNGYAKQSMKPLAQAPGKNFNKDTLKARFPQMREESGWNKELVHNQIILSQEKAQLEAQCAELTRINMLQRAEIDKLKKQVEEERKRIKDLENNQYQINELQEKPKPIEAEKIQIGEDLEEKYASLIQGKLSLDKDIDELKKRQQDEQIYIKALENIQIQIKELDDRLRQIEIEKDKLENEADEKYTTLLQNKPSLGSEKDAIIKQLQNELELERNKGILQRFLKK